ncbi:hypothetical protein [Kiloniella sp. b19]|uniref:hypothetical protein n=1 Tax=Kiloniella sp. GXU_MW_B19 TaxID=3141326 RepID=UPI0031D11367
MNATSAIAGMMDSQLSLDDLKTSESKGFSLSFLSDSESTAGGSLSLSARLCLLGQRSLSSEEADVWFRSVPEDPRAILHRSLFEDFFSTRNSLWNSTFKAEDIFVTWLLSLADDLSPAKAASRVLKLLSDEGQHHRLTTEGQRLKGFLEETLTLSGKLNTLARRRRGGSRSNNKTTRQKPSQLMN